MVPEKQDNSLDLVGFGKIAEAIPGEVYTRSTKTLLIKLFCDNPNKRTGRTRHFKQSTNLQNRVYTTFNNRAVVKLIIINLSLGV